MTKHLLIFMKGLLATLLMSIPMIVIIVLAEHFELIEILVMGVMGLLLIPVIYMLGDLVHDE